MLLELKALRDAPGAVLPFSFVLDLSGLDFLGQRLLPDPVSVSGTLANRAGAYVFDACASFDIAAECARCLRPLHIPQQMDITQLLAESLQNEDNDDILLIEGGVVDAGELVRQALILDMDLVHLCSEDCPGLCPVCGEDLNAGDCECAGKSVDDRLAGLADILKSLPPDGGEN